MGTPGYVGSNTILYKPQGEKGQTVVMLPPSQRGYESVQIVGPDGKAVSMGTRHQKNEPNEHKYFINGTGGVAPGSKIVVRAGGKDYSFDINDPAAAQVYKDLDMEGLGVDPEFYSKGMGGGGGEGGAGDVNVGDILGGYTGPDRFKPGNMGYGVYPAYQGKYFPKPWESTYTDIEAAPYDFTDPVEFAKKYGEFARSEYAKNMGFAKDFALDALDTELQGMMNYVPAAAALQRREVSLDNIFNQAERTKQIRATMPEAEQFLKGQMGRAETYASGNLPDSQQNAALEMGIRSRAADAATAGGFGAQSFAARKGSELMSAEERFKIAQYGEQLGGQNIQSQMALLLAPTEYSNAGSQVRVMPSLSGSQLQTQFTQDLNRQTMLDASQAFQGIVSQNQFTTNLQQRTNEFNATNKLQNDHYNTTTKNQFALDKFNYDVGYAGVVAGQGQVGVNTALGIAQQQQYADIYKGALADSQAAQEAGAITSAISSILMGIVGLLSMIKGGGGGVATPGTDGGGKGDNKGSGKDDNKDSGKGDGTPSGNGAPTPGDGLTSVPDGEAPAPEPEPGSPEGVGEEAMYSDRAPALDSPVGSVLRDYGIDARTLSPATIRLMNQTTRDIQAATGYTNTPRKGYVLLGINSSGQQVYANPAIAKSSDVNGVLQVLDVQKNFVIGLTRAAEMSDINFYGSL